MAVANPRGLCFLSLLFGALSLATASAQDMAQAVQQYSQATAPTSDNPTVLAVPSWAPASHKPSPVDQPSQPIYGQPPTGSLPPLPGPMPQASQQLSTQNEKAGPPLPHDAMLRQKAWETYCKGRTGNAHDGIVDYVYTGDVMCVLTRENMITTVTFPTDGERVIDVANGSPEAFATTDPTQFHIPSNYITIRPKIVGADTTINVTTDKGALYPLYVASYPFDNASMTDVVVRITRKPNQHSISSPSAESFSSSGSDAPAVKTPDAQQTNGKVASADANDIPWPLTAPPSPRPYSARGTDPSDGPIIQLLLKTPDARAIPRAPLGVWRDSYFTYVEYGDRLPSISAPIAAQIIPDGTEKLVQWRWEGTRLVLTGTGNFVLRSGPDVFCILEPPTQTAAATPEIK